MKTTSLFSSIYSIQSCTAITDLTIFIDFKSYHISEEKCSSNKVVSSFTKTTFPISSRVKRVTIFVAITVAQHNRNFETNLDSLIFTKNKLLIMITY